MRGNVIDFAEAKMRRDGKRIASRVVRQMETEARRRQAFAFLAERDYQEKLRMWREAGILSDDGYFKDE